MKTLISIITTLLLPLVCLAGDGFVIKGKVSGIKNGTVVVSELHASTKGEFPAAVRIVDGEFTYEGKIDLPRVVILKISMKTFPIFLENTHYVITCNYNELATGSVTGGSGQKEYADLLAHKRDPVKHMFANPDMTIFPWMAWFYCNRYEDAQKALGYLTIEARSSLFGQELMNRVEKNQSTLPGKPFPVLGMKDSTGKAFSMAELNGKIVVLDFWASWCAPCRAYTPKMRQHYQQFSEKGVVFLSVSLDESHEKWMEAMRMDKMEWGQVMAEGGFKTGAPSKQLLNIIGIPHVYVLGKDGKIAANLDFYVKETLPEVLERLTKE